MNETATQFRAKLPEPNAIIRSLHYLQLSIAIIVLCLDVYGVHFVPYNALVCSCIASICTIPVCMYLIMALSCLNKLYSPYVASAYHIWMMIFWVVDLALVAQLAKLWSDPECIYDNRNKYMCAPYQRRQETNNNATSFRAFYGALVAGAGLAAFELALWVLTASFLFRHWKRSRAVHSLHPSRYLDYAYPSREDTHTASANIPFQDISSISYPQVFHIPAPQDPWNLPFHRPGIVRGPIIPDTRNTSTETSRLRQDPLSELTFGSPVSSSSDGAMTSLKGFISRDAMSTLRRPGAARETSGPPSDTQQKDWSAGSSIHATASQGPSAQTSVSAKTSMSEGRVRSFTMDDMPYHL